MKLIDVVNSQEALKALLEVKMAPRASFKVTLLVNKLDEILKVFNTSREKLVKEAGTEVVDKPGTFEIAPENQHKFVDDLNALLAEEVTVEVPEIKIDDVHGDIEAKHLMLLTWLIKE